MGRRNWGRGQKLKGNKDCCPSTSTTRTGIGFELSWLLAYEPCPAQHKHDGKGTQMLVDTLVVCPNPCLSNETAARPSAPALPGLKQDSLWDGLLGAGTHTLAPTPLLIFPLVPLLMAARGRTLTFRYSLGADPWTQEGICEERPEPVLQTGWCFLKLQRIKKRPQASSTGAYHHASSSQQGSRAQPSRGEGFMVIVWSL